MTKWYQYFILVLIGITAVLALIELMIIVVNMLPSSLSFIFLGIILSALIATIIWLYNKDEQENEE